MKISNSSCPLETEWEMLFNRCLLEGKILDIWKNNNMYILFKGKGNVIDSTITEASSFNKLPANADRNTSV